MATTDQAVFSEAQRFLLENSVDGGATWGSGLWTVAEVVQYANNRQSQFLKDSGILIKRSVINTVPNVLRHPLPADWILTFRVAWEEATGRFRELSRADGLQADLLLPSWQNNMGPRPLCYTDGELPSLQLQVMPAPNAPGVLELLHAYVGAALTAAGVNLTIPDDFSHYLRWGIMSDMLGKVGRGQDVPRAEYCELRFQEGIELGKLMISGWG